MIIGTLLQGKIGNIFGKQNVSIQSIVQFDANSSEAEIVVITHKVSQGQMNHSLVEINKLSEVNGIEAKMCCL